MKKKVMMGLRIVLGLMLVVFGLNGFLQFMSMGAMPEAAAAFMAALMDSGLMYVVKVMEILIGLMLLTNRYTALALVALVPLSFNFVFFHIVYAPSSIAIAAVVFILNIVLMYDMKDKYAGLCKT